VHLLVTEQNNKRCTVQGIKITYHSFVSLQLLYVTLGKNTFFFGIQDNVFFQLVRLIGIVTDDTNCIVVQHWFLYNWWVTCSSKRIHRKNCCASMAKIFTLARARHNVTSQVRCQSCYVCTRTTAVSLQAVFCLMTHPQPLLHTARSSASPFNIQYLLFSLRSPSSCSHLLPRLPVTAIIPSVFTSVTYFRTLFLNRRAAAR